MRLLPALLALALATALVPRTALGAACPTVMIILDRSGSMDENPAGGDTPPSKLDIAKTALNKLVMQYGAQLPLGFTSFAATGDTCGIGVDILVKPMHGTAAAVTAAITAVMTEGSTNTGPAIDQVVALPEMNDPNRPGSYILLVTDGEPNCPGSVGTETDDPAYTVGAIKRAAAKGIKTFVIGFGALPSDDQMAMNMMAAAGLEPCTGTACNGQQYFAAEDDAGLTTAINAISDQIVGEFGGMCDDSCYANGCPNAGQICVAGACVTDPCASVASTCAPGDYCYTDGTSPGSCTPVCPSSCPSGESCGLAGCALDPCTNVSCDSSTSYCNNGVCVTSSCGTCAQDLFCINGQCKDDPCRYVQCPTGTTCQMLKGTCSATDATGSGAMHRSSGGCHFAPGSRAHDTALMFCCLCMLAIVLRRSRRA